jgi:hypothetical protein
MAGKDELVLAAADARAKATQAHEAFLAAKSACEGKVAEMAAFEERLGADREALAAAMVELGTLSGEAAARLALAINQAAVAVGEVGDTADGVAELGPRMLAAAATDLDESAEQLAGIGGAIGHLVAAIQEMHRNTFERIANAETQLQTESDRTESILRTDPVAALERHTPAMEELLDDALEHLETTLPQAMERMVELWETRREQAVERAAEAFASMQRHAEEVTAHCVERLAVDLGAERETAATDAARIAGELTSLASSLDGRRAELESALEQLADRFASEQADLRAVVTQLESVRGTWATFGFA